MKPWMWAVGAAVVAVGGYFGYSYLRAKANAGGVPFIAGPGISPSMPPANAPGGAGASHVSVNPTQLLMASQLIKGPAAGPLVINGYPAFYVNNSGIK